MIGRAVPAGEARPVKVASPKEEKQPASAEVVEVAPGVLRMQLPIQFTGLGHVNMYGLIDRRGLAVVDPGMPGRRSWQAMIASLGRAGYRPSDVHTVLITHSHPDHFGAAARLAAEAGAAIVAHTSFSVPWLSPASNDVAEVDGQGDAAGAEGVGSVAGNGGVQVPWRAPGDVLRPPQLPPRVPRTVVRLAWRLGRRFLQVPVPTRRLADGERVRLADRDWFAVHTPGHTADHLCLHDPEQGILLAGDHVLPTITPHVSGVAAGPDPLADYLSALAKVAALDVALALPAHGQPFADLARRTTEIVRHHEHRLELLRDIAANDGPGTVEGFARALFPETQWGFMVESEVFAHLEHLVRTGAARAWRRDGVAVYDVHGNDDMP